MKVLQIIGIMFFMHSYSIAQMLEWIYKPWREKNLIYLLVHFKNNWKCASVAGATTTLFDRLSQKLGLDVARVGWGVAKFSPVWLEHLTANAHVVTVLGSIPASSDTVKCEGRQMEQC